jgi:hypothetical protein
MPLGANVTVTVSGLITMEVSEGSVLQLVSGSRIPANRRVLRKKRPRIGGLLAFPTVLLPDFLAGYIKSLISFGG